MGTTEVGGYEYADGNDNANPATISLNLARSLDVPKVFATETDRNNAKTAFLAVAGRVTADAVGMRCYVTSRGGYCTWNGTAWVWDATNIMLSGGSSGLTVTTATTTPGSQGQIGTTITANLVGQRAIRVEFSAIGFRANAGANPIYARIDFEGSNLGEISGRLLPFTIIGAPGGALDVADIGLTFVKTAKMTGTISLSAMITIISGDFRPYVQSAAIRAWDCGPVD
jgi:hypothetical protein